MLHLRLAFPAFTRRIAVKEIPSTSTKRLLFSHPHSFCTSHCKYFSVSSKKFAGEKPVILSAGDIVNNDLISESTSQVDPSVISELATNLSDQSFADYGLATTWWPSHIVEGILEYVYMNTGLPWWATIVVGTLVLRVITMPMFIASRKVTVRFSNHMPQITKYRTDLMDSMQSKDIQRKLKARKDYSDFMRTNKVQMWRMILFSGSMPILFTSSLRALNEMAALPLPSLEAASFLWLTSLSSPDPYRALPFLAGSVFGLNIYAAIKLSTTVSVSENFKSKAKYLALVPPLALPLIFGTWSSAFMLYMGSNACVTLAVTVLLKVPFIERSLNMPVPLAREGQKGNQVTNTIKDVLKTSRDRAALKVEVKEIRQRLKQETKDRKKELKGPPPALYTIGDEAILKDDGIPDFKKDWRPPRVNIYER